MAKKRPQIAVLQSLSTDANNGGPFFSPFLKAKMMGGWQICPTKENLNSLLNDGRIFDVEGNSVDLVDLDGLIWRAKVSEDFEISSKIQELLRRDHKVSVMEDPRVLAQAVSKIQTFKRLVEQEEHGVIIPKTIALSKNQIAIQDYEQIFDELACPDENGQYMVIVKPEFGFSGKDLKLLKSPTELEEYALTKLVAREGFVAQSPIYNEDRSSIRVDIVAGKPIHAMRFHPKEGEQSSTSGRVEKIRVSDEILDVAIRANQAIGGLFFAGVDIMQDAGGKPHVLEVNIPGVWYLDKGDMNLMNSTLSHVANSFAKQIVDERANIRWR